MNRDDFRELAEKRLRDAQVLLRGRRCAGAYYLAGYAVECGLKACIARQTREFDFPPKPNAVRDIYVHDLTKLIKAAGLYRDLEEELIRDKEFGTNWGCAKDWSENSRYTDSTAIEARSLFEAVADKKHGVLRWISRYW